MRNLFTQERGDRGVMDVDSFGDFTLAHTTQAHLVRHMAFLFSFSAR
jgi:hypothetical protein